MVEFESAKMVLSLGEAYISSLKQSQLLVSNLDIFHLTRKQIPEYQSMLTGVSNIIKGSKLASILYSYLLLTLKSGDRLPA